MKRKARTHLAVRVRLRAARSAMKDGTLAPHQSRRQSLACKQPRFVRAQWSLATVIIVAALVTATHRVALAHDEGPSDGVILAGDDMLGAVVSEIVDTSSHWRLAVGTIAGVYAFDPRLDNYRWDTRPAMQWGAQAAVVRGRFAGGLRAWRTKTSQGSGIPGESRAPTVNVTAIEVMAQVRIINYRRVELWSAVHSGRIHMGYDPDRLTFNPGGAGIPVTVDYKSISEWDFGAGIEVRSQIARGVALSLHAEQSSFALDTAHRNGTEVLRSRERFYSWQVRLQIAWLVPLG
jgi:hypothetical protein